jgi:serine/threonine protein kinase
MLIVMEYMARGSLSDVLNDRTIPLPEAVRVTMAIEAARGGVRVCLCLLLCLLLSLSVCLCLSLYRYLHTLICTPCAHYLHTVCTQGWCICTR